jgi:hypothetical protein
MSWKHMGEWRYSSTFLVLGICWRWMVSFTFLMLYTRRKSSLYPLDRRLCRPQSLLGHCGEEKNLALLGIEPRPSSQQPVAKPTDLSRLSADGVVWINLIRTCGPTEHPVLGAQINGLFPGPINMGSVIPELQDDFHTPKILSSLMPKVWICTQIWSRTEQRTLWMTAQCHIPRPPSPVWFLYICKQPLE